MELPEKKLSDAELDVMLAVWQTARPCCAAIWRSS